ncbi:MAG: DnaJ domain-containing protein [Nanoarchaeota archaeon]
MVNVIVKGHEFSMFNVRDSYSRRAVQFKNNILESLRKIGIKEDDVEVSLEAFAIKKAPASTSWYIDGYHLYYSYNLCPKFVENLYVVSKVIELEVEALLHEQITIEEFTAKFSEDHDIEDKRKQAREVLGLDLETTNLDLINKTYRDLAKEHHPDMPNGNTEKFKKINNAHKLLKRELE